MMRVRVNTVKLLVRTPPMVASPISGDYSGSGKGIVENAYDPIYRSK